MIGIIDCGVGNVGSLRNSLLYLGAEVDIVSLSDDFARFSGLILPGVGSFDAAISSFSGTPFQENLNMYSSRGMPILGICLGMQILAESSEEGCLKGLNILPGKISKLSNLNCHGKIPHIGFNTVYSSCSSSTFLSCMDELDFYFVHTYAMPIHPSLKSCSAVTDYAGSKFISALNVDNIFATQFHPEKSGDPGLNLLEVFLSCSKSV